MWVTNNLGYDITLSEVLLYKNSQQEVSSADAEKLLANDTYALMIENGNLTASDTQPEVNIQYYVRPLEGLITLNGFPSNPNGTPEVSPVEAFAIGKEEGGSSATLENNKTVSITENGTAVIEPSEDYDGMKQVTANVAVPVPVLEANKATTIDVSAYTEPIEVTPTSGKTAMEKNTITLTNIPSGGGAPSMSSPMCLCFYDNSYYYIGILANGTIAQSISDIPNIKWFVNVEGGPTSRDCYTTSQDNLAYEVFNDYTNRFSFNLHTYENCTIEINNTTVTITYTDEYEQTITLTLTLSDNIPLMLFVGINPTS